MRHSRRTATAAWARSRGREASSRHVPHSLRLSTCTAPWTCPSGCPRPRQCWRVTMREGFLHEAPLGLNGCCLTLHLEAFQEFTDGLGNEPGVLLGKGL
jgi:hypothetical protein